MKRLWTPWRADYVSGTHEMPECLFCWLLEEDDRTDEERLILFRGRDNYVVINRFPYNNGHLMIAPYRHVARLTDADPGQLEEMIRLARDCEEILRRELSPDGLNLGMNVGSAAGAGVAEHHHLHLVPRWQGDTNFMSTTQETRIIPEAPEATYRRFRPAFAELEEEKGQGR